MFGEEDSAAHDKKTRFIQHIRVEHYKDNTSVYTCLMSTGMQFPSFFSRATYVMFPADNFSLSLRETVILIS